jgi:ligand-binding sensor domain-containing protein/signal transduction histidine kinase
MYRFSILCIGLLIAFVSPSYSQNPDFKFRHFSTDQGLSHDHVLAILKDSKGFMWFGTEGGLNKYDGYEFTIYRNNVDNPYSIKDNYVHDVLEDRSGNLLVGINGGLEKFDYINNRFLHGDINGFTARDLFEDKKGNLWLATDGGLFLYDVEKGVLKHYAHNENDSTSLSDNLLYEIAEDNNDCLWIVSRNGLNVFDPKKATFKRYFHDKNNKTALSNNYTRSVFKDSKGSIWVGTRNSGVSLYNPKTDSFINFKHDPDNKNSLCHNDIFAFSEDEKGNVWIGTENGGIDLFNLKNGTFKNYTSKKGDDRTLSNSSIYNIYRDDIGNMWLGTYAGGVNMFAKYGDKFYHYKQIPGDLTSLSSSNVLSLGGDSDGNIWVGTDGDGLNLLNKRTGTFLHYVHDPKNKNSISNDHIFSVCEFDKNTIIVTFFRGGFDVFKKNTGQFTHHAIEEAYNIPNPSIIVAYKENENEVWLGTSSLGLWKYNIHTQTHKQYIHEANNPHSLSDDVVTSIYKDHLGNFWFGTSGGLSKYDRTHDNFIIYKNGGNDSKSLSHNSIYAIFEDSHNNLWIGTAGGGLNLFDRTTNSFKAYTEKNGLANNTIFGILEDEKGNLWVSTNKGISKFDLEKKSFRNYDVTDGVQGNQFRFNASYKAKDGEMYFGGTNGVNTFYPDKIIDNPFVPPVKFTEFEIFNKPVELMGIQSNISRDSSTVQEITLDYTQTVFTFKFAALNFTNSEKNQYAYKLEGFDNDWNAIKTKRTATYTNLDPGHYTFKVIGSNNDGVWNKAGAAIELIITPPMWKTWWFRIFAVTALLLLLFFIYRLRVAQIEKQKRLLEYQVTVRTKEVVAQKEEIESQKESIEEKSIMLEKQYEEIMTNNEKILLQNNKIEEAQKEIQDKNEQLENIVKMRTEQLRKTFANLKETNNELDQFIYRSAHDLKGPIATIIGLCHVGELETQDEKIISLLGKLELSAEEMARKLARLMKIHEINTLDVNYKEVHSGELIKEIIEEIDQEYHCKEKMVINVRSEKNAVRSDRYLLKIMLRNIIENSIKFRDQHKAVNYVQIDVTGSNGETVFSIIDNGVGIPKEEAHRVFDLFVVATEHIKGYGIGLYESKLIARRLNGNIELRYPQNGETEFRITLGTEIKDS